MNPSNPHGAAIAAGREVLKRIDGCLGRNESLAVETTLSSRASLALIDKARARGYEGPSFIFALDSPKGYHRPHTSTGTSLAVFLNFDPTIACSGVR